MMNFVLKKTGVMTWSTLDSDCLRLATSISSKIRPQLAKTTSAWVLSIILSITDFFKRLDSGLDNSVFDLFKNLDHTEIDDFGHLDGRQDSKADQKGGYLAKCVL